MSPKRKRATKSKVKPGSPKSEETVIEESTGVKVTLVEREALTQRKEGTTPVPPLEDDEEDPLGDFLMGGQEEAESARVNRREAFEEKLHKILRKGITVKNAAQALMKIIPTLGTKLGKFYSLLEKSAVAPEELGAPPELLPISLKAVGRLKGPWDMDERAWIHWVCWNLNFNFCTGWEKASNLKHPSELTDAQKVLVKERIYPAVQRLTLRNVKLPNVEEVVKELHRKGQDYDGTSWVQMEELDYDKVVACWPSKEGAAVQPITKFLEGETLKAVETPLNSILPYNEWPAKRTRSYVRASDEVWNRLIAEGFKRGMFQACPPEEVLRDEQGRPVLNGAGAVPKEKGGQMQQRFISIFVPLNEVSAKIPGDEGTLPYVGQVLLLNVPREDEVIVDSEDLQSAFNLFEMPPGWRGLFCYEKKVPGSCLGLDNDEPTFVALKTVPMGWLFAVGIVQAAIRHLAFKEAGLPMTQELQKNKPLPDKDRFLLYLDSVDQLRVVSRAMSSVILGESSAEHKKLEATCERFGLPRNSSKRLAGALRGSLQGGELVSQEGVFMLEPTKMQMDVGMCLALAALPKWGRKEISGVVGRLVFAGAFRRPLLSALSAVFHLNQKTGNQVVPTEEAYDEVLAFSGLLPMAFTNVRAKLGQEIHATDASPTGAGSCIAEKFKRAASVEGTGRVCISCRRDIGEPGEWNQAHGLSLEMWCQALLNGVLVSPSEGLWEFNQCHPGLLRALVGTQWFYLPSMC